MINYRKRFVASLVAGIVLWLGLSPRTATPLYEAVIMPRVRSQEMNKKNSAEVSRVQFFSHGRELEGMLYKHPDSRKIVLYCGGRRSNLAKLAMPARALLKMGVSVFVFEPAGFGNADGRASLHTLVEDGLSAYDAAMSLAYAPENIVLYGESLGAAVAAYISQRRDASGLILQSGFCSLESQINDMFPILRIYPTAMYPQPRLATAESLRRGHPPLLIVHGNADDVIEVAHAHRLAASARSNTTLAILAGAGHFALYSRDDWFEAVSSFLGSL
jgi:hypothetical protein